MLSRDTSILITGFGSVGRRHFKNLIALGYTNISFFRSGKGAIHDTEIEDYPSFDSVKDAFAHDPAIVIVANPSSMHLDVAMHAASQGCHLFIEKPLSNTLERTDELRDLVRKNKLVTMINCQFRFHPQLQQLHASLQSGKVGNVISARSEWGEFLPDWHPWEDYRRSYSARSDLGGGVVLTLIHPLDYMYWLFGTVTRVHSAIRPIAGLNTEAGEDVAEITLEFESGTIGQVHLDYIQKPPVHTLTVQGDAGRAHWDYYAGVLAWEFPDGHREVEKVPESFERNTMFLSAMKHFLTCVDQNIPTLIPLDDGIEVLKIALSAKKDASTGNTP